MPPSAEADFAEAFLNWNWIIPDQPTPILDDDGNEIVPFQSDAFGGRDVVALMQSSTPLIARIATIGKLPIYLQGFVLEYLFIRPLEAAPWRLYEAALLVQRSVHSAMTGQPGPAIADIKAANAKATEAALAIMAVIPVGAMASKAAAAETSIEAQLEARGVKYLGSRFLPRVEADWARAQQWITKSCFEHGFFIEGTGEIWVDGFKSTAGEFDVALKKLEDIVAVEVKLSSKVEQALAANKPGAPEAVLKAADKFMKQLDNYVLLGKKLGLARIEYVICDPNPFSTTTIELQAAVRPLYPELVESGWLRFVREIPPPSTFISVF